MRNIELKVKVDFATLAAQLKRLDPSHIGTLIQKDTYYLLGARRLKIREEEGKEKAEIIYYERADKKDSKDSHYFIFKIRRGWLGFVQSILGVSLGVKGIVEKQRELYLYRNTRIHVDTVKNLGGFLELETVVGDEKRYDEYRDEHAEVINLLQLNKYPKLAQSYSDLVSKT